MNAEEQLRRLLDGVSKLIAEVESKEEVKT